jgi:hypothetical protein
VEHQHNRFLIQSIVLRSHGDFVGFSSAAAALWKGEWMLAPHPRLPRLTSQTQKSISRQVLSTTVLLRPPPISMPLEQLTKVLFRTCIHRGRELVTMMEAALRGMVMGMRRH